MESNTIQNLELLHRVYRKLLNEKNSACNYTSFILLKVRINRLHFESGGVGTKASPESELM